MNYNSQEQWNDLFYDYFNTSEDDNRPGSLDWEQYVSGMPFNGNQSMDLTNYAGKEIKLNRAARRYA